ncbi:hypothetical protein T09_11913 [Trichinella sp. T9]|nr:hypothetical protein T09_11913 [Trichinella sp. T9]
MQILSSTIRTCVSGLNTIAYGGGGGVRAGHSWSYYLWLIIIRLRIDYVDTRTSFD